jgi:hypothetical protein
VKSEEPFNVVIVRTGHTLIGTTFNQPPQILFGPIPGGAQIPEVNAVAVTVPDRPPCRQKWADIGQGVAPFHRDVVE